MYNITYNVATVSNIIELNSSFKFTAF